MEAEAVLIEKATEHVLEQGMRTIDIADAGMDVASTSDVGNAIVSAMELIHSKY